MFGLIRLISARIAQASLRQTQTNQLNLLSLVRSSHSAVTRFGNTNFEGRDESSHQAFGKGKIYALLAVGGLGLTFADFEKYQANCAGKYDDCVDKCGKKCKDPSCIHKMDKEEKIIEKANQDLVKALENVKPKAMVATEAAIKAFCEAALIIKEFMDKAYCAMEKDGMESPEFEETWCEVYDLAVQRCEKVKEALHKAQCAWELLCKLREIVENGKSCKYTSCHPLLITAEEFLLCAERELLNARAKMDCVQSESRLVPVYHDVLQSFRTELKAEVGTVVEDCNLSDDECAKILSIAYKKVMKVQKELALLQVGTGKVPCKQAETLC